MEANVQILDTWTDTKLKLVRYSHKWTINNFSFCKEKMRSSTFTTGIDNGTKWCLEVYPYGPGEERYKDYVSVFLILLEKKNPEVRAKFKFSVINAKKQSAHSREITDVHFFTLAVGNRDYGFTEFIRRDFLLDQARALLPCDKLTILCEAAVATEIIRISGSSNRHEFQIPECQLHNGLGLSLESTKFSDVTLAVYGREFRAHKVILAAASPVFAAMFEHEMEERKRNRVEITDIEPEALAAMLRFIYTSKAPNLKKMASDLLSASDKYDLQRLKALCEKALFKNLTIENAANTLMLADLHNAGLLKELTIDFINMHTKQVMDTAGFEAMVQSRLPLVAEILRASAIKETADKHQ